MKFSSVLKAPWVIVRDFGKLIITYLPGSSGNRLRYLYYKRKLKSCGKHVIIDMGVVIDGAELISLGNYVHIDKYCIISTGTKLVGKICKKENSNYKNEIGELIIGDNVHIVQFTIIMAYGGISIGNNCTLSAGCKLYSLTNTSYDLENRSNPLSIMPYEKAPFLLSPIVLDDNVWLGLNCIAMPGTIVGKNSFAVSNSLLMGLFSENSYIAGQPAVSIKKRYAY
jgi:acetyltransferase-like isoleucine patch superfamily enzyme